MSPSLRYPFPLKRPISSSQAPDRSPCPVGQGSFLSLLVLSQRKPLRWASFGALYLRPPYWMSPPRNEPRAVFRIGPSVWYSLFRRGAHRAPAKYRAAVIRRGGYYPPAAPVLSPSVGAGPRPARRCISGNDGMGMFRLRAGYFPGKESSRVGTKSALLETA